MKHRHNGQLVRYRTRKNNLRFRKRPLHQLKVIRTLPGGTKLIKVPKGMSFEEAWKQVEIKK